MKGFLYFTAAWCQPCQTLGPTMDNILRRGITVKKIDADYDVSYIKDYNVRQVPTIILFDEGRGELGRRTGVQTEQSLIDWFNNA
jgi:thioredoxin 1